MSLYIRISQFQFALRQQSTLGNFTSWTYDKLDRLRTACDAASQLMSRIDRNGRTKEFGYDALGRAVGETWKSSAGTTAQLLAFAYDPASNLTDAANAAGAYSLGYDARDRAQSVAGPFGVLLSLTCDATGNRLSVADNFGGTVSSTYDALNRLSGRLRSSIAVPAHKTQPFGSSNRACRRSPNGAGNRAGHEASSKPTPIKSKM